MESDRGRTLRLVLASSVVLAGGAAQAEITFSVTIDDPAQQLTPWAPEIEAHVLAAGQLWANEIAGEASIEVLVRPGTVARATGRSLTSAFVRFVDGKNVFEQGVAAEIRTGLDPNGPDFDAEIVLNPAYVAGELWFDPDPTAREAVVPTDRTDAMSVFLHELGHAIAYNGWNDGKTNPAPNSFKSTWDCLLDFNGQLLVCNAPTVIGVWGEPPETTLCSRAHWGNPIGELASEEEPSIEFNDRGLPVPLALDGCCAPIDAGELQSTSAPLANESLVDQLMNGVVFIRGRRYSITLLDRALLFEVGVDLAPCPPECPGDADRNGAVGFSDITTVLGKWLEDYGVGSGPGDANGDGIVNFADITRVLNHWLESCDD